MKSFKIFLFILSILILSNSCTKEEMKYTPADLSSLKIASFFEFENGDRWFYTIGDHNQAALFLSRNGETKVFNEYFNGIEYVTNIYKFKFGPYGYISDGFYPINIDKSGVKEGFHDYFPISLGKYLCYDKKKNLDVFYEFKNDKFVYFTTDGISRFETSTNIWKSDIEGSLALDSNGGLWTGYYHLKYFNGSVYKEYNLKSSISYLVVDDYNKVWGLDAGNLCTVVNDTLVYFNSSNSTIPNTAFYKLVKDNDNNLWLMNDDGIYKYDIDNDKFELITTQANSYSTVYIGGHYKGIYCIWNNIVYEIAENQLIKIIN